MENNPASPHRAPHGLTGTKKTFINELALQAADAKDAVRQAQAVVTALTEKSHTFTAYLEQADASRVRAHANKDAVDTIVQHARELRNVSAATLEGTVAAAAKVQELALQQTAVINKCIVTAELVNKLSAIIMRQKALNPLISDTLTNLVAKAGRDADIAVALSLVALSSVFASQGDSPAAEAAAKLTAAQAAALYAFVSGDGNTGLPPLPDPAPSLQGLLDSANQQAQRHYIDAEAGNEEATRQLSLANAALNTAQVKLHSLQAGLGAAGMV